MGYETFGNCPIHGCDMVLEGKRKGAGWLIALGVILLFTPVFAIGILLLIVTIFLSKSGYCPKCKRWN